MHMVVSIDYSKMEAIRAVQGVEERQALTPGEGSGFAVCTWLDGSTYQSAVANLLLDVKRAPLKVPLKRPAAAKNSGPAAAPKKKPAAAALAEESGEEEVGNDMDEEVEEEEELEPDRGELEQKEEDDKDEPPPAKKAKTPKADEDPAQTHIYIYMYILGCYIVQCLRQLLPQFFWSSTFTHLRPGQAQCMVQCFCIWVVLYAPAGSQ